MSYGANAIPTARRVTRKINPKGIAGIVVLYLLSVSLAVVFMFPYFYTVMSSLKKASELFAVPPILIPKVLQWRNYLRTVTDAPYALWFQNTLIIALLSTTGGVLTSSLVAFGFARFRFRFRDALFLVTLSTLMLPAQVTLIPNYIMFFKLGQWTKIPFLDTFRPLWVPAWFGGGAFAIFLLRQFLQTIPKDLDEAALIDGASYPRIYWQIVLPLCKPAIATLILISVIGQWNSFLEPMIYINTPTKFPISVGIQYFNDAGIGQTAWGEPRQNLLMCASVLSTIVPIVLFFTFQQYFVQGVVMSGIKG